MSKRPSIPASIPRLEGYFNLKEVSTKLAVSLSRVYVLLEKGRFKTARATDAKGGFIVSEAEILDMMEARDRPRCLCCKNMDQALRTHHTVLEYALRGLKIFPGSCSISSYNDYDSAYSDGYQALWKALKTANLKKMGLQPYLYTKVQQAVIDGLRSRGIDSRRSEKVNTQKLAVLGADSYSAEDSNLEIPDRGEWDTEESERVSQILILSRHLDPLLPKILEGLGQGHTQVEIAQDLCTELFQVSKAVKKLRTYCAKYPDMVWRPSLKFSNGDWVESDLNNNDPR